MDLRELHGVAVERFDRLVRSVPEDGWANATPCTEWSVRDLVNHLVNENLWTPELLAGKTIEEVGDRFDGDLLGDDPLGAWERSAQAARDAVANTRDLDQPVNVSWGQIPAQEYISQLTLDHVVHGWDLGKGIGRDADLEPATVEFAWEYSDANRELITGSGVFGSPKEIEGNDTLSKLLALLGRDPEYPAG